MIILTLKTGQFWITNPIFCMTYSGLFAVNKPFSNFGAKLPNPLNRNISIHSY